MNTHLYWPAVLAAGLLIGACSGDGTAPPDGQQQQQEEAAGAKRTDGPLNEVQEPVSEEVFGAFIEGAEGTPLEPILQCTNNAITFGALDIADAVLVALESGAESMDPQSALEGGAEGIQAAAEQFGADLQNLLLALTDGECRESGPDGEGFEFPPEGNPFEGTPFEPIGELFEQFPGGDDDDGEPGEPGDLQALSDFFAELNRRFQNDVLSQFPEEAREAPVFGGVLTTLEDALNDLDGLLFNVSIFDDEGATEATQTLLNNALVNLLTEVVPIRFFEEQAGMEGEFSGQIEDGVTEFTDNLGDLQQLFDPLFNQLLGDALQPLIGPIGNEVLPAIFGPLTEAFADDNGDDPGNGDGPTGTPLDQLIAAFEEAFGDFDFPPEGNGDGDNPFAGTPLGDVIDALMEAFGGNGDGGDFPPPELVELLDPSQLDALMELLDPSQLEALADMLGGDGNGNGGGNFDDFAEMLDPSQLDALMELLDPSQLDELISLLGG